MEEEKNYQQVIFFSFSLLFFTDTSELSGNLWPPRVSLSFLLFVLIFSRFSSTFNFFWKRLWKIIFEARREGCENSLVPPLFPQWCFNCRFRNYTEMKMSPPRWWNERDFIKSKKGGERQSTIKVRPLWMVERGRGLTHTYRLTNTINHFFRGLPMHI